MKKSIYTKNDSVKRKKIGKITGIMVLTFGLLLLAYFFFPLISYQLFLSKALATNGVESPVPRHMLSQSDQLSTLVTQGVSSVTTDYKDARNWAPEVENQENEPKIDTYHLSIPKLKVENAKVSTNTYDLSESLVQYYGEDAPPNDGTAVIYGHSSLPQLFNPKNYETIFATAHNLKLGDEMYTHVNGKTYKYKVFSIEITDPEDVNIFRQSYDNSYITLVTCTPPGTIWKRLVIRASLEGEV